MSVFLRWFSNSQIQDPVEKRNFINVQIDAIGVGLASAAAPFLPVFLTRLGASSFQIGLLTAMPALAGFLLSIPMGRFLQGQRRVVPWFSSTRLGVLSCFALTGLVSMITPPEFRILAVLAIWALATIPQTMLAITFSVVMNAVAGPRGRFELMSRRWAILGFTQAAAVLAIGQVLDIKSLPFPLNYELAFIGLSVGGLLSFFISSRIQIAPNETIKSEEKTSFFGQYREYLRILRTEKPFTSFVVKRLVFMTGSTLALPLFPLYYVRVVQASDSWIAAIATSQTAVMILGYFFWTRQSRARGSRPVLLWTTLGLSIYPVLVAFTAQTPLIALLAGFAGIFQAGLDLVFFDELMNTVPPEYSATFVSFAQSLQYLSSIVAPLLGTFLADQFGIGFALIISGAIRLIGFLLFASGTITGKYVSR